MKQIDIALTPESNPESFGSLPAFLGKLPRNSWGKPYLPNKALPENLKPHLEAVHQALFSSPLPAEGFTVCLRENNGQYQRTMTPFVTLGESNLVLHWGDETVSLVYSGDKSKELKSASSPDDSLDTYEIQFAETSFGIGVDPCLKVTLDLGETLVSMPFALYRNKEALANWDAGFKVDTANRLIKKGGSFEGYVSSFSAGGDIKRLYELEVGKEYVIIGESHKEIEGANGKYLSTVLTLEDNSQVFGNKAIANVLLSNPAPVITKAHPATLSIFGIKGNRVNCSFIPSSYERATAAGIDYSFLEDAELTL